MAKIRKPAVLGGIAGVMLVAAAFYFGGHRAPAGQSPLVELNPQSFDGFRSQFNAAAGQYRVILLLSPT